MKLSIVIVNYNVKYYLEQCLYSVRRAMEGVDCEVWMVDNASTDGSVAYIRERFPEVKCISNMENAGFSRANNQAIRCSQGEYVLLLNPDTILGEHTLHECLNFMDAHPEAGGCGVGMLKADGGFAWESRRGLPTPFTSFCKMSGLCALFPRSRVFGKYYMRYLDYREVNRIEVISGAFMMMRRKALDEVGMLDEDFFMYGEDIDMSYRLMKGGYTNYYVPTRILHYKGESTVKNSFRYVHVFYRSMVIFFDKHFRHRYCLLAMLIRVVVILRAALDLLTTKLNVLRYALLGEPGPSVVRHLFVGSPESAAEVRALSERNGISMDYWEVDLDEDKSKEYLQVGRRSFDDYHIVVYDTAVYSYSVMLQIMEEGADAGQTVLLGTYSPESHVLITPHDIYL
ncbi:MAG: glycosyltransferase family 2 protein [Clostridium sp.]|nr:glycosyltransferase family 2 protein [Clostridium sp.]